MLDSTGYKVYASNMKTVSARLLMLIAVANNYDVLTGDIGNAYLYAKTNLPVYVRLGKEFNIYDPSIPVGSLATVEKALYGILTSANRWHAHLSDTLLQMGFKPSWADSDVWMRQNGQGYDYVGTHTDDLMVVSKDAKAIMDALSKVYTIKKVEAPKFHLGCDYKKNDNGTWSIGTTTYVAEALKKIRIILGKEDLGRAPTPMASELKPEIDDSPFLSESDHRKYQQILGIMQWLITCGRSDLAFSVVSLSRFAAAPREKHLVALTRICSYLNKHPDKWIVLDPSKHVPTGELTDTYNKEADWSQHYPEAQEELDPKFPKPLGEPMDTAVYFDSNFAHDEVTRKSITGFVGYVGNTPVTYQSTRQGAIATSTYTAELCAAKTGTEEAISLRYMLRSLGVPVRGETLLIGDNLGLLISAADLASP